MSGDRCGGLHTIFLGRFSDALLAQRAAPCPRWRQNLLHALLHIEHKIDLGGGIELELLDHHLVQARRAAPVDAVEAIAWLVFTDGRDVWRHMKGATLDILPAGQLGAWQREAGERGGARVDQHLVGARARAVRAGRSRTGRR